MVQSSAAQRYFSGRNEFGWLAGASNYHGDLAHGFDLKRFHLSGGLYYKYTWNSYFSNRLQATYLKVSGTDVGDRSYDSRNLTFQTPIWEVADMLEFNFQKFGLNYDDNYWTPYFLIGVAGFMMEPTRLENDDINLRNLRTEGQKRKYSRFQPAIPMGFGIKTMSQPSKNRGTWILGIEGVWRKTFTDYLDDVNGEYPDFKTMTDNQGTASAQYSHAQTLKNGNAYNGGTMRGDTHLKDWYYFLGFTLAFRFPGSQCP